MPSGSTTAKSRDPALDGLRGLAVLLVFLSHYGGGLRAQTSALRLAGHVSQAGWVGVELFFALSGFLITRILLQHKGTRHELRSFYARRALRVLPLYLAALATCAVAALLAGAHLAQLRPLWLYVGFLQNIPPFASQALHTPPPLPLYHLWSLAVEEQFYLLWPLVLLILLRLRGPRSTLWFCLGLFGLSGLNHALLVHLSAVAGAAQPLLTALPFRAGGLALGAALAVLTPSLSDTEVRRLAFSCLSLASLVLACVWLVSGQDPFRSAHPSPWTLPLVDLAAAALVALALYPGLVRTTLSNAPLRFFGRISYGFYVLHLLLMPAFDWAGSRLTHHTTGFAYQGARLVVALPVSTLAAWLSFHFYEQPFLRGKKAFPYETDTSVKATPFDPVLRTQGRDEAAR